MLRGTFNYFGNAGHTMATWVSAMALSVGGKSCLHIAVLKKKNSFSVIYEILFVSEFDTEAYKLQAGKWKGEKRKKNNRC